MADKRSEHVVKIGGVEHVLLLTDEDAEKYADAKKESGASKRLAGDAAKAIAASNKALQGQTDTK